MDHFYVLYGTDKGLIEYELKKIIHKLKIEDIVKYDMTTSNLLDVIEDVSTVGLFSSNKLIILEDAFFLGANRGIDHLEVLEDYIEHYNSNNYCIFLSYTEKIDTRKRINKLLSKHQVMEFNKKDENISQEFVKEYLRDGGYKIEDPSFLLERCGTNLSNLKNELDKLMMYCLDSKMITTEAIQKITTQTIEKEIFVLTDAIIARDTKKSLSLLEDFRNLNYDEIQIIMLLATQFRFLFQVKRLINKNKSESEIAKILEVNPYRVKFTVKKLYAYSEDMIIEYIQRIAQMDHDIKLGIMNKKLALELFITHPIE